MERFPQVLENIRVARKEGWDSNPQIKDAVNQAEEALKGEGRVFVRASGTEPLIRVMAEGPDEEQLKQWVGRIAGVIQKEQG